MVQQNDKRKHSVFSESPRREFEVSGEAGKEGKDGRKGTKGHTRSF
jgi:hypothetical protein